MPSRNERNDRQDGNRRSGRRDGNTPTGRTGSGSDRAPERKPRKRARAPRPGARELGFAVSLCLPPSLYGIAISVPGLECADKLLIVSVLERPARIVLIETLLGLGGLASALPISAQEPARPGSFREEARVERVIVDAYVTDRYGDPIPDLTATDFRVRVDGKPVPLES